MRRPAGVSHRAALISAMILAATPARADDMETWVRGKLSQQRLPANDTTLRGKAMWREKNPQLATALTNFRPPTSLAPLIRAVLPAVVNISATGEQGGTTRGSGFIISPDGLVVTNNHVVDGAHQISVQVADGRKLHAALVGRDPSTDLALLRVHDASGLSTVVLGDSDGLEVGDWVVAIGNPFGLETSVTHGIISARERVLGVGQFDDFIQINAHINPGNSGGPLFDMKGTVVGVNTAVATQGQGIGFAVPINLAKDLLPNLMDNGRVDRGWLGVSMHDAQESAPVIGDVYQDSPAAEAGIQSGDAVVGINGKPVQSYQQLLRKIALLAPGTKVRMELLRAGKPLEVSPVLAERQVNDPPIPIILLTIPAIGLTVHPSNGGDGTCALVVRDVALNGPARRAGLARGDRVIAINGHPPQSARDLELSAAPPNRSISLRVQRANTVRSAQLAW